MFRPLPAPPPPNHGDPQAPEHETKENRKAARKERNRISAQLSRDRKKHEKESLESRLESAEQQVRLLTQENAQLKAQITKNKDVEDQLEGLRLRFLELERMMLAAAGSSRSPSTQPVTTGSQQTTAKVEVDESEAVAVEREQGAERRPGLSNQTDVVEAPSSSASPADEEQDSRIGNETSAAGMPSLIICSKTLSSEPSTTTSSLAKSSALSPSHRRSLQQSRRFHLRPLQCSTRPTTLCTRRPLQQQQQQQQDRRLASQLSSSLLKTTSTQRRRYSALQRQDHQRKRISLPPHPSTSSPTSTFYYHLPHFQAYLDKLRMGSKAVQHHRL